MNYFILGCEGEENKTEEHAFIEYVQPEELFEFYDLSDSLTAKSHHTIEDDAIVQSVHELYTNLTNRLNETKRWCVDALGIEEQVCVFVCMHI